MHIWSVAYPSAYTSGACSYRSLIAGTSHSRVSESHLKAAFLHATSVSRQTHKRINTQACHSALQGSRHRAYQLQNTSGGRSRVSCLEEWRGRAPLLCDSTTAGGARCWVSLCDGSHHFDCLSALHNKLCCKLSRVDTEHSMTTNGC